ncbi:ead/Ea22-like family protein [Citrobacter koseri]|uniref:ead/Ea22-like family protein n=1 Tax=Citrobacter koseri TaxID=545 RepID=UPI001904312C|nr:ead/Ea22-like family protein [Citrobacter koseri]MBJ8867697.1 ead/Ea22-like family protein [Citrobacter koseri]
MSNIDKQALRTVAMLAKELSGISMYSKAIAAINKFHELFTPDVALALLDELESKQTFQQAFFRQSLMYDVVAEAYEEAKEQIAKDVEIKARLCTESNSLFDRLRAAEKRIAELREWNAGLAQESFERQSRIAELESRTVTLEPFRSFVTDADITALHRFAECCDDPESGGHDLEKEQVRRLEAIGALQRSGRISYITDFGDVLISITAGIGIKGESNNG